MSKEIAIVFECISESLVGIIHKPAKLTSDLGVLIVVGGPQTRVGSHRQFVLLARYLCQQGIPVMRFDYRGMGDSSGDNIDFDSISVDIKLAIDQFQSKISSVDRIVIWALCDAVSAALFYAYRDTRISGLVLLNPWVRTEIGEAKAYLRHYYLKHVFNKKLWGKIFSGKFDANRSIRSFFKLLNKSRKKLSSSNCTVAQINNNVFIPENLPLPEKMAIGLERFKGGLLLILSGNNDFVADEFRDVVSESRRWQQLLVRDIVSRQDFPEANHTFSKNEWRQQVERWTLQWLQESI